MALGSCKYRHLVPGTTEKSPCWWCDCVKAIVGWDHGFGGNEYCMECILLVPVEAQRPTSPIVAGLAAAAASVAVASGPGWRTRMLPTSKLSTDQLFSIFSPKQEQGFVLDVLQKAVLKGEDPAKAAALMDSYMATQEVPA